ncbi:oxygenase [Lithospermum erythrorhizon]|uniref:Oxygenase n=1 Tax=Lithospermum erythrorhizon TaxID=34254 RepID=A0AAV3R210_LITER
MEYSLASLLIYIPIFLILHQLTKLLLSYVPGGKKLPPGPPGWPVFGHMFNLGTLPYATMARLKDKYGPVLWLRLGSVNTMVILNASAAEELFKNHDASFCDRKTVQVLRSHNFHKSSLALSAYTPYWRMLRRLCTMEIFATRKINMTVGIRRKCIDDLVSWIEKKSANTNTNIKEKKGVHIAHLMFLTSFNIFGNLMMSRDVVDPDSEVGSELFTALVKSTHWAACPNISDLFEFLKPFDLQGLQRNMNRDLGHLLEIVSKFVKERMKEREDPCREKTDDFLDVLLDFEGKGGEEPKKLSEHNIFIFILEMFLAGAETTSTTTEWALSELLRNPKELTKVKMEVQSVVGPNRKLEESDIENLPFLQAIVKETLRLHPVVPFLLPRSATKDTNFMGYDIPKNTQVLINAWAIGRDPETWDDPSSFKPERFLDSNIDYRGQHFELIPFGAGRRMCVGLPLAHRTLHLMLGSLLHEFDWELEDSLQGHKLDMTEQLGITVRKLEPLKAVPTRRAI